MKNYILLSTLMATSAYSVEESCLDKRMLTKEIKTITGSGLSIEEAQIDLHKKLPMIGVLQTVKLNSVKTSTPETYSERSTLSKSINANFNHFSVKNCRLPDGRFASSVAFPIEGVSYLPAGNMKVLFSEPSFKKEYATFSFAKSMCGDDVYSVIVSMNDHFDIAGGKVAVRNNDMGIHTVIVCGQFKLQTKWFNHGWTNDVREVFAERYNMIYLGSYRNKDIRDYSQELGLEMIKNAM